MRVALPVLLLALAAASAQAQSAPEQNARGALRSACKADFEKLCKGTQPGGGRIIACLKSHDAELSPDCKAALAQTPAPK